MPAGYVEVDELPSLAAERETREESGLIVKNQELLGAYYYNDDTRGNGVVILYRAKVLDGKLTTSDETLAAKFFSPQELYNLPLAGMSAEASIQDWLSRK